MIDKKVYLKILRLISESQSRGETLYIDDLIGQFSHEQLTSNLEYLKNLNLISRESSNVSDHFGEFGLTHLGHDFLDANGGLTREVNEKLNTVFIKIDEEQFKALLVSRVEQSDLPETQKQSIISAIKNLPADSLTYLATKLLDAGLESLPNVLQSIGIG